jgi:hypothetical protein
VNSETGSRLNVVIAPFHRVEFVGRSAKTEDFVSALPHDGAARGDDRQAETVASRAAETRAEAPRSARTERIEADRWSTEHLRDLSKRYTSTSRICA